MKKKINSKKLILAVSIFVLLLVSCSSDSPTKEEPIIDPPQEETITPPPNFPYVFAKKPVGGKDIYIPDYLKNNDYTSNASDWSYQRSASSENVIVFWEKGFGQYPNQTSRVNLQVDVKKILDMAEEFFAYYKNTMKFIVPGGSKTDNYRMIISLLFSEDWVANGAGHDDTIGMFWVTPSAAKNRVVVAHELGHSFQYQAGCDSGYGFRDKNYVGSFWEQCANYMSWQLNNDGFTNEIPYFLEHVHLNFSHEDYRYQSMYLQEYWKEKHGEDFLGKVWRGAVDPEGPLETYMRLAGLDQDQFNDEFFEYARKNITWDYPLGSANSDFIKTLTPSVLRDYKHKTKLNLIENNYFQIDEAQVPEDYGYNAIKMIQPNAGTVVTAELVGLANEWSSIAGWRWGFVSVKTDGTPIYGTMQSGNEGAVSITVAENTTELWLVVTGAPTAHVNHVWDDDNSNDIKFPYKVKFTNATPE